MSRFAETQRVKYIDTVSARMVQAGAQLSSFNQTVQDIYSNWLGYINLEADEDELESSRVEFANKTRILVDERKAGLAAALDIIAGGMRNEEGEPLTRQDLLDELAQIGN